LNQATEEGDVPRGVQQEKCKRNRQ
jgi:hypothetical protein